MAIISIVVVYVVHSVKQVQIVALISSDLDSLRNNNISDEGIRKLAEKGVHCECFTKVA